MKSIYLILGLLIASISSSVAQTGHVECGMTNYLNDLYKEHPSLKVKDEEYSKLLTQALQVVNYQQGDVSYKTTDSTFLDTTTQYYIPVVFHILHTYNQDIYPTGASGYLSYDWIDDEQIYQCLESINHDFNGSYLDTADVVDYFKDKVGNARITFVLANKDPFGNCTNGINRIHSYKSQSGSDQAKLEQWPQSRYLNIWLAQRARDLGGNSGRVQAYAVFPSTASAAPFLDGIISDNYDAQGRNAFDRKSVVSHEIGHILSLFHTWGNGQVGASTNCDNGTDQVDDTPPTNGFNTQTPASCESAALLNTREDNCWTKNPGDSIRFYADPDAVSNVQNIMEYANCSRMFTKGQTDRMRGVLQNITSSTNNGKRENLITPANHAFTGIDAATPEVCTPIADFYPSIHFLYQGTGTVRYTNFSYNADLSGATYKWTAPGSSVPNSTASSFLATQYADGTGWQSVTLEAKNGTKTGTTTKDSIVFIQHDRPAGAQSFEDDNVNAWWPMFNYYDNMFKWDISDYGAYYGTKCLMYRGFDGRSYPANAVGNAEYDYDDIFSEAYDLSNINSPKINFYISGAATSSNSSVTIKDYMEISYSTNGGITWRPIPNGEIRGSDLYTKGVVLTEYYPVGYWDYKPITIELPTLAKSNKTLFRFRMHPGKFSNNVFIDDINVTDWVTSIDELEDSEFSVSPNPLNSGRPLSITSKNSLDDAIVSVTDVTGRVIYKEVVNSGSNTHTIDQSNFPSAGFYIISLSQDGKSASKKLSVF